MFELPEVITLASQANETLTGRVVRSGSLGNRPHKFVWYNRSPEEFAALAAGRRVGRSEGRGKWLIIGLDPGYVLVLGECGGRLRFHPAGEPLPDACHLSLEFEDGSALTALTAMWGAMELHEAGAERDRPYLRDMRPTPVDGAFTWEYFATLAEQAATEKRTAKGLLTQEQLIPGLGNAIAQDILYRARLHPRRPVATIDDDGRRTLFEAIVATVSDAIAAGGRADELDLHGNPGGYARTMHSGAVGRPCPACGASVVKIQYLGGACYLCASCQV